MTDSEIIDDDDLTGKIIMQVSVQIDYITFVFSGGIEYELTSEGTVYGNSEFLLLIQYNYSPVN